MQVYWFYLFQKFAKCLELLWVLFHVKIILPIDPYFSFDILKMQIINKHLTKYFRILITPSLFYLTSQRVILIAHYLIFLSDLLNGAYWKFFFLPFSNPYIFETSTLTYQYVFIFLQKSIQALKSNQFFSNHFKIPSPTKLH